jgi:transcriptional regulator GlxA family with amidase domain
MAEKVGHRSWTPGPVPGHGGRVHEIVIPLVPGFQPLDVTGPHEVFAGAAAWLRRHAADRGHGSPGPGYRLTLVAAEPGPIAAESGLTLVATGGFTDLGPIGTLLVPGGRGCRDAADDPGYVDWLRRAATRADRVASVCSGAFPLAATGLLAGLTVTTHWRHAAELARRHPELNVQVDPVYVRQGRIWTSAGVTAGIDLALALVEADHGAEAAQAVARELVVFARRPGGQSQFAAPVWAPPAARPSVAAAQDLIHADPAGDLRVPVLAERVGMSERHFSREFTRLLGCPPADYVERVRVDAARRLLESEPVLMGVAARRCGFGSAETMRRAFLRRLGVPPDDYRRRFALHA